MIIFKQKYEFDILINFYVCPIMYGCGGTQQIQSNQVNQTSNEIINNEI